YLLNYLGVRKNMALSVDLRKRILEAYENNEGSIRVLAERFKVGFITICRLLKKYRKTCDIESKSPPGRTSKIDKASLDLIAKLIANNSDSSLFELVNELAKRKGIKVSHMAVHRACQRLELRYKKNDLSRRTTARGR